MEETAVADGLWQVAHGRVGMDGFIGRFGFHGPDVGNVASRSWREDARPVERLLPRYAELGADRRPVRRAAEVVEQRLRAQAELLSVLRGRRRVAARMLLRSAPRFVRDLQRGKTSYLIALDAARGAARSYGRVLATRGVLADPEDIFHLTAEEILDPLPADVAGLIDHRKGRLAHYRTVICPETWIGRPEAVPVADAPAERPRAVTGLGVSSGTVEGTARVVLDPADAGPVEEGDILVCPVTDPSWVCLMAVAAGLVIDIGSSASHGALIARELGVPCVINTGSGTRDLTTGDRIRVDGDRGTVEVLERHPRSAVSG
jgi:pyruvate,water dikinase